MGPVNLAPQWYIRLQQRSVPLKSTTMTFQLRSNYIRVLGVGSDNKTTRLPL